MANGNVQSPKPPVHLVDDEYQALRSLASSIDDGGDSTLRAELERAQLIPREHRPPDLVTMNSKVRYRDLGSGSEEDLVLVWPQQADPAGNQISVLSPVGSALIGFRVGDEVVWPTPGGLRRLKIIDVEQDYQVHWSTTADVSDIVRLLTGQ